MQGKATIAGHPVHPVLVTFPIGCFVAAVVCDIISIWAGPAFWSDMSTWLLLFGVLGAVLSAFFGLVDYLSAPMSAQAKSVAGWHMTLNIGAIVIFGLATAVRFVDHSSPKGYALTGIGIVVLGIAGYLGGEVAHRHLVGSSEGDADVVREAADRDVSTPSGRRR